MPFDNAVIQLGLICIGFLSAAVYIHRIDKVEGDNSYFNRPAASAGLKALSAFFALATLIFPVIGQIFPLIGRETTLFITHACAFNGAILIWYIIQRNAAPEKWNGSGSGIGLYLMLSLGGGGVCGAAGILNELILIKTGLRPETVIQPNDYLVFLIFVLVWAPVAEEFLFRRLFFRGLNGEGQGTAPVILSSFVFAAMHPISSFIPLFSLGCVTAVVYRKTGKLWCAVVIHFIYNTVGILFPGSLIY